MRNGVRVASERANLAAHSCSETSDSQPRKVKANASRTRSLTTGLALITKGGERKRIGRLPCNDHDTFGNPEKRTGERRKNRPTRMDRFTPLYTPL
ncbi:hypothetical protein Cenrod_0860 [Candidatus Symbiobacter mobilis CR]|uniref:Uncharacterized protein n=1 Tax=Candidatus Symbiobacter mobilis CR TaxID=946483 RepID=U5N9V7_9BURK|nr:hypothetical protein Cenrod_0860 [Candidatus Symbiobacter mobilis CR]